MKKDFSQPFEHAPLTNAFALVEVERDSFVQFEWTDELGTSFYEVPSMEINESEEVARQLARALFRDGLCLTSFRELARETSVGFSFVDDAPGGTSSELCFYASADRINQPSLDENSGEVLTISLREMSANFQESPYLPRTVALGIARLQSERSFYSVDPTH